MDADGVRFQLAPVVETALAQRTARGGAVGRRRRRRPGARTGTFGAADVRTVGVALAALEPTAV